MDPGAGDGADYTAWSAAVDKQASLDSNHSVPAVADTQNRGIVYGVHVAETNKYRIYRKQSADDSNANDVTVLGATPAIGDRMGLTVDRGDIYAFYETSGGQLAYRKHFPETGWDATETIIGTSPSTYATARQNRGDGSVDQYDRLYRLTSEKACDQELSDCLDDARLLGIPLSRSDCFEGTALPVAG